MFGFGSKKQEITEKKIQNFQYLKGDNYYFDSSCTTLRPNEVITAETDYYYNFNSCGHRVKYKWGEKTDSLVEKTRNKILEVLGKKNNEYLIAFTYNTTFGINQILWQLLPDNYEQITISEIEHNSVFLPSLKWSQKYNKIRNILKRDEQGNLLYNQKDLNKAIVIVNSTSNIDGRDLQNATELAKDIHKNEGILLLDACQTMGHNYSFLKNVDFDGAFFSGHKMYGPSLGIIVIKRNLIENLDLFWLGGGTVEQVQENTYQLITDFEEKYSILEPGLQNFAGIIALEKAISWKEKIQLSINNQKYLAIEYENYLAKYLNQKLLQLKNIHLLNKNPSPVVSLYTNEKNSHDLAIYLSEANIMLRSGYFCCHYYLTEKLKLPPLLRVSLGLNNTIEQIDYLVKKLKILVD